MFKKAFIVFCIFLLLVCGGYFIFVHSLPVLIPKFVEMKFEKKLEFDSFDFKLPFSLNVKGLSVSGKKGEKIFFIGNILLLTKMRSFGDLSFSLSVKSLSSEKEGILAGDGHIDFLNKDLEAEFLLRDIEMSSFIKQSGLINAKASFRMDKGDFTGDIKAVIDELELNLPKNKDAKSWQKVLLSDAGDYLKNSKGRLPLHFIINADLQNADFDDILNLTRIKERFRGNISQDTIPAEIIFKIGK